MRENIKREALRIGLIFFATTAALAAILEVETSHQEIHRVTPPTFPEITLADAYYLFKKQAAVFVDMRSEQEFARGHISGALSMPNANVDLQLPPTPPTVVIYGTRGFDANMDALGRTLLSKGQRDTYVLTTGWSDWRTLNLPSEKNR